MRFLVALILLAAVSPAAADVKAGEKKAQLCVLCHRAGGPYGATFPLLEGRTKESLVAAITDFKEGRRISPAMQPNVERLSARDIADIAEYFSATPADAVR